MILDFNNRFTFEGEENYDNIREEFKKFCIENNLFEITANNFGIIHH